MKALIDGMVLKMAFALFHGCYIRMEDIDEEIVYAVIDTNLDIIVPFRPINNIAAYLKEFRKP